MKKILTAVAAFAILRAIVRLIKARSPRAPVVAPATTSLLARLREARETRTPVADSPLPVLFVDADWERQWMARATRNDFALGA